MKSKIVEKGVNKPIVKSNVDTKAINVNADNSPEKIK
jgi:hypothetical protein